MPDVVSPAEELTQLKQDLEGKQNDTSRLAKETDQLKARIADLSKTVVDIDQKNERIREGGGRGRRSAEDPDGIRQHGDNDAQGRSRTRQYDGH